MVVQIPDRTSYDPADQDWWTNLCAQWGAWSKQKQKGFRPGYSRNRGFEVTWDPKAKETILTVTALSEPAKLWLMLNPHPNQTVL